MLTNSYPLLLKKTPKNVKKAVRKALQSSMHSNTYIAFLKKNANNYLDQLSPPRSFIFQYLEYDYPQDLKSQDHLDHHNLSSSSSETSSGFQST